MKIAVIGAGYAGLAVTWHLFQKNYEVTVFEAGEGASHISTGLLHSSPGRSGKPTWRAEEGMESAKELLEVAGKDTFLQNGIYRFIEGEKRYIPEGITVFSRKYLLGLKKACKKAKFISHFVKDLEELASFDKIVLTVGAQSLSFFDLPLKKTIGQCLICECPEPIPISLLGMGHITPTEDPHICLVGSTYEHTHQPDPKKALALIDQVSRFYPLAKSFKIREISSATRISPKVGYKPLLQQIDPKVWVFAGLGSRGLIYHALFAKDLCSKL